MWGFRQFFKHYCGESLRKEEIRPTILPEGGGIMPRSSSNPLLFPLCPHGVSGAKLALQNSPVGMQCRSHNARYPFYIIYLNYIYDIHYPCLY